MCECFLSKCLLLGVMSAAFNELFLMLNGYAADQSASATGEQTWGSHFRIKETEFTRYIVGFRTAILEWPSVLGEPF